MIPRMIFIPLMLPVITVKPGSLMFRALQVRLKTVDMNMNDVIFSCQRREWIFVPYRKNVFHTCRFISEY